MLSSDKNVETIAQLAEVLRHYLGLWLEYVQVGAIDKVVRLLTAATLAIVFFLLAVAVLLFFWVGVALWIGSHVGYVAAFLVVSAIHAALLVLFIVFRKSWIERPLVRFLARLFMS